jgi:membrane protease YdiL (CAAX protease family)
MRVERATWNHFEEISKKSDGSLEERHVTPDYMSGVVPTIAAIAAGLLFPQFRIGALAGLLQLAPQIPALVAIAPKLTEEPLYQTLLAENALITCVAVPIVEEILFRGILQSGIQKLFEISISSSMVALPFTGPISTVTLATIFVASTIFGAVHVFNDHKFSYLQAIHAFIGGFAGGFMMTTVGLKAACAAHIVNNSAIFLSLKYWKFCASGLEIDQANKQIPDQTEAVFQERLL